MSAVPNPPEQTLETFCADPAYPPSLRELARCGEVRRYRKGTILIHEADIGDTLFILLSGRIRVFCTDASGKEITFGFFAAGEYFGEMALDGGPRSASVITTEASDCVMVARSTLLAFIARRPEFALELLGKVISRLRRVTNDARSLAFVDVYGRLTRCLMGLATAQAEGTLLIAERLTHQEIASRVGCSREMVSRILKDLESGGYIALQQRRIRLVKKLPAHW